jgi:hypothetical protein
LIEALKQNQTLTSLNLGNNKLSADIGSEFMRCLDVNRSLIDFEFGLNNFDLKDVSPQFYKFRSVKFRICCAATRLPLT